MAPWRTLVALDTRQLLRELPGVDTPRMDEGDWRTVVELLTQRIQADCETFDAGDWVQCSAVYLDALEGAERAGAYSAHEVLARRLNLTCVALRAVPEPSASAALTDPRSALRLVVAALPPDITAVVRDAARWRDLPTAEILRLRLIKVLLRPAMEIHRTWPDPDLDPWVEVADQLP